MSGMTPSSEVLPFSSSVYLHLIHKHLKLSVISRQSPFMHRLHMLHS